MATHFSILAWRIPMEKGAWRATVHRVTKSQTWLKWLSTHTHTYILGFPQWLSGKRLCLQCWRHRRRRLDPCVGKTPQRRKWQPTPVFLPEKSHREKPGRLQSLGLQRVGHDWAHTQCNILMMNVFPSVWNPWHNFSECFPYVNHVLWAFLYRI